MASEELKTLVDALFTTTYRCMITTENLAIIRGESNIKTLHKDPPPQTWGYPDNNGVTKRVDRSRESFIIAMLDNEPKITKDMERLDLKEYLTTPSPTALPICDMAELLYNRGEVYLCNPSDCDEIEIAISKYLQYLDDVQLLQPHFKMPPSEDLNAFRKMREIVLPIAQGFRSGQAINFEMAMLMDILGKQDTATKVIDDKPVLKLNGLSSSFSVGEEFKGGRSPYDFG